MSFLKPFARFKTLEKFRRILSIIETIPNATVWLEFKALYHWATSVTDESSMFADTEEPWQMAIWLFHLEAVFHS